MNLMTEKAFNRQRIIYSDLESKTFHKQTKNIKKQELYVTNRTSKFINTLNEARKK